MAEERVFKKELLGYSKKDVTEYIDKLVTEYDQLTRARTLDAEESLKKLNKLIKENNTLRAENEAMKAEKAAVADAMVAAQKAAAEQKEKAQAECEALRQNFKEEMAVMEMKKAEAEEKLASFQKEVQARIRNLTPHVEGLTENE